jgi:hypothetical protein
MFVGDAEEEAQSGADGLSLIFACAAQLIEEGLVFRFVPNLGINVRRDLEDQVLVAESPAVAACGRCGDRSGGHFTETSHVQDLVGGQQFPVAFPRHPRLAREDEESASRRLEARRARRVKRPNMPLSL